MLDNQSVRRTYSRLLAFVCFDCGRTRNAPICEILFRTLFAEENQLRKSIEEIVSTVHDHRAHWDRKSPSMSMPKNKSIHVVLFFSIEHSSIVLLDLAMIFCPNFLKTWLRVDFAFQEMIVEYR